MRNKKKRRSNIFLSEEVDSLIEPAEEKLKKSREELAKIDKLRNAAVKRKNEDKAELASLKALKTRIIEKTT
jgi:dsDNA-specific endonuclease/ATPase MutS2